MCRAPLGRPVEEEDSSDDDDDDDDDDYSEDNYETIPVTLINAACLGIEETAQLALDRIVDLYNEAMVAASNSGTSQLLGFCLIKGQMLIMKLCAQHLTMVRFIL